VALDGTVLAARTRGAGETGAYGPGQIQQELGPLVRTGALPGA
jgi:hypothetical protein